MFAPHKTHAAMYSRVGVETAVVNASPHRLITMLFDAALESIARARGAMVEGQIAAKGAAIGRAVRIVDEGLKDGLNLAQGGRLASDLGDLYAYITERLTHANLRNELDALDECKRLLQPLRDAWVEIGPQVEPGAGR